LYLCECHAAAEVGATALGQSDQRSVGEASISLVETDPADDSPAKGEGRTPSIAVADPKPSAPTLSEAGDRRATKASQAKVNSLSRGAVRDLSFGNPAKALVEETIWNIERGDYEAYRTALQEGKSTTEAAQVAGGQLAVVHRKIREYAVKVEALLSSSEATMNVSKVIEAVLESETQRIICDNAMTENEKDIAIGQLGGFEEWVNGELDREMTPLQAHRIAIAIGDRANWGAGSRSVSNELRLAYGVVYRSIRDATYTAVPEVREQGERLANLYAAKSDLEAAPDIQISATADLRTGASV
jgi:hypothetical protein